MDAYFLKNVVLLTYRIITVNFGESDNQPEIMGLIVGVKHRSENLSPMLTSLRNVFLLTYETLSFLGVSPFA